MSETCYASIILGAGEIEDLDHDQKVKIFFVQLSLALGLLILYSILASRVEDTSSATFILLIALAVDSVIAMIGLAYLRVKDGSSSDD